MKKFPFIQQEYTKDCGPACLQMICKYYGKNLSLEYLRNTTNYSKLGVSFLSIKFTAEQLGFRCVAVKSTFSNIIENGTFPCILFWQNEHFVVLINKKKLIADPATGIKKGTEKDIKDNFLLDDNQEGLGMFLEPTNAFFELKDEFVKTSDWKLLLNYFTAPGKYYFFLLLTILISASVEFSLPGITKNIVDKGVNQKNISFVEVLILAQFALLFGKIISEFVRNKILLSI